MFTRPISFFRAMRVAVLLMTMLIHASQLYSQSLDYRLLKKVHVERNPRYDSFFLGISHTEPWITVATPLLYGGAQFLGQNPDGKENGYMMAGAAILSVGTTTLLKESTRRERPYEQYPDIIGLDKTGPLSFPSGHTASAFNLATSVSLICPKWYVVSGMYLWAGTVGYSRMRLGVHFPSDVLAGALIGTGCALLSHRLMQR